MHKKGVAALSISIVLLIALTIGLFFFFALYNPNYGFSSAESDSKLLVNPINGLITEEAVSSFNESFIYYLLYSAGAYKLHSDPLLKETPRIEIFVDSEVYNAEISNGVIYVSLGEVENKDIIIRTTKIEAVKMLQEKDENLGGLRHRRRL